MTDFFRGWRRKAGVVTLVMACVFAAWFVRSLSVSEVIMFPLYGQNVISFQSSNGSFVCECISSDEQPIVKWSECSLRDLLMAEENAERSGVDISAAREAIASMINLEGIPYLSIILPLTAISAWLLLSTPRKSNRNKSTETTSNDEA